MLLHNCASASVHRPVSEHQNHFIYQVHSGTRHESAQRRNVNGWQNTSYSLGSLISVQKKKKLWLYSINHNFRIWKMNTSWRWAQRTQDITCWDLFSELYSKKENQSQSFSFIYITGHWNIRRQWVGVNIKLRAANFTLIWFSVTHLVGRCTQ